MNIDTVDHYETAPIFLETFSNPLLHRNRLISFNEIQPRHFMPAFETIIEKSESQLQAIESLSFPTWDQVIIPLEQIEESIFHIVGPMIHLILVTDSDEMREAWSNVEPLVTQFQLRITQSKALYHAFEIIRTSSSWDLLSDTQQRIITQRLHEAQLKGVHF